MRSLKTLSDMVDWGMCIGCGACAYACKKGAVRMVHAESEGFRPVFDTPSCSQRTECVQICPGAHRPHVFVGKPCDTAAVSELRHRDPELRQKIGLVLTFFCAGTPSTRGTLDLLKSLEIAPEQVEEVHYRGEGWPGEFRVLTSNDGKPAKRISYAESWSRLTAYRPLRCNLCPDGLGRVADIACGDAWDQYAQNGDPGRSLVLVRTERGRQILDGAQRAGYVTLRPADSTNVLRAQENLLERRRALFGRLMAFQMVGAPIPAFEGFSMFRSWRRSGHLQQFRSVAGTLRRIVQRGWYRRRLVERHS